MTRGERRLACATLLGAAVAVKPGLYLATGLYSQRYAFPFVLPACLWLLACAATELFTAGARARWSGRRRAVAGAATLVAVLALVFERGLDGPARYLGLLGGRLRRAVAGTTEGEAWRRTERERLARLQAAVPAGEPLLVRLETQHLLDFRRAPIWIIDLPGGAGPPPGMPLDRGPDALAEYLLGQRVRYVAYDYVHEGGLPEAVYRPFLRIQSPMIRGQTERAFAYQRLLMELVRRRRIVHDDGVAFVMDLASSP